MTIKAMYNLYVKPYLVWVKVALLAGLFALGWTTSCSYYKKADLQVDNEQAAELAACRKANYDYAEADKLRERLAAEQAGASKIREEQAQQAAGEAMRRAQTLQEELDAIEARQIAAENDPKCRDILELEVCEVLR